MRASSWLATIVMLVASRVHAQGAEDDVPPPPPPAYQESIPPAPRATTTPSTSKTAASPQPVAGEEAPAQSGARVHDGLQLRFALGLGGVSDALTLDWSVGITTVEIDGNARGGSLAFHLGIGGEVAEGLTLGGYLLSETLTDPTIEFEGTVISSDVDVGTLGMLGVFVDYYPNPRGGFHFGGGLGGATLKTSDTSGNTSDADQQPAGGGAMLLIGYDWWIGDEWSMGFLVRITGAGLRGDHIKHDIGALAALFSVAYH